MGEYISGDLSTQNILNIGESNVNKIYTYK